MDSSLFKKLAYFTTALVLAVVAYLAFIRNDNDTDTASSRNGSFLGLKSTPGSNEIDNQNDLDIDDIAEGEEESSEESGDQTTDQQELGEDKEASLYTVKEGDTYGCIAEAYYGSYEHWVDILNANIIYGEGYSERELHVGAVIEMPAIPAAQQKPASNLCS